MVLFAGEFGFIAGFSFFFFFAFALGAAGGGFFAVEGAAEVRVAASGGLLFVGHFGGVFGGLDTGEGWIG